MNQTEKDVLINRAISLFNQGQIKKALKEALVVKKKYPDEPFIHNLLGVLYAHTEAFETSIKSYTKAIKLNPNYFEAYNNIGVAYTGWKKNNKAIEFFNRAIQIKPSYSEAHNNKGNALKEKGEYKLAKECYIEAIKLNPNYIDAILNLGIVANLEQDFTESERYFHRALSLDPTNISVLYNLANCLFNAENFKQSIIVCQQIINIDPSFHFAYNRIGLCYIQLENQEKAKVYFEKAVNKKPDYSEGLTNYGFILQKLRDYSLATVQFEKALMIDPDSNEALLNLSKSYFDEGRLEKAIEVANKGLLSNKKNIPLLKNLIASFLLLNRLDEASIACEKILSINNNDADAINLMGTIYEKQGFYEKAKEHFLRALQLDKNLFFAKMNIATLHQLKGHIGKAVKIYNELSKEYPDNVEILYRKSGFALQLEKFKEAWKCYEYRWKVFPMNTAKWPIQGKAVWKGEKRKRVVLWKEQGIGDQILCLSLVPEVKEMCSGLSVYIDPRLIPLCRRAMPEINFFKDEKVLKREEYDYHLPLGSVPRLIRNDISDFDRTVTRYLKADPQRVEAIRKELKLKGKRVIGISWKSFKSLHQIKKSVQLKDMACIFSGLDVVLVNLQYGDVDDEIRAFKEESGIEVLQCASVDNREDLDGLAALIEVCDLVISTSNVTVHMAGALAKETWVLLPNVMVNFWWLLERPDSIWYPRSKHYRQRSLNDWDNVYSAIRKDLQNELNL